MNLTTESELATLIMISNNESNDRLDRLMKEPIIYSGYICGNWHYYIRASLNVDACDEIFWNGEYIKVQRNHWIMYMCIYYEDDFQFAIPEYTGIIGHADQYAVGKDSGKLDSTVDCKDIIVRQVDITKLNDDCRFRILLSATKIYCIYSIDTGEITSKTTSTYSTICEITSLLNGTSAGQEATPIIGKGIIYIDSIKRLRKDWWEAQL